MLNSYGLDSRETTLFYSQIKYTEYWIIHYVIHELES